MFSVEAAICACTNHGLCAAYFEGLIAGKGSTWRMLVAPAARDMMCARKCDALADL
jgi:hypothetical protein